MSGDLPGDWRSRLPAARGTLRRDVPLAPLTWLRVGGPAEVLFQPADAEDLAGFLAGLHWGLPLERCAQLGSQLATYVIETKGTQEYELGQRRFLERFEAAYGLEAVADIQPHVKCPRP